MSAAPREDQEAERRRALELVWGALSRRAHTVAEMRAMLERRGVEAEATETAIAEVAGAGYLDDADFARRFTEDRRRLDRWGEQRIARALTRRGIPRELAEAALAGRTDEEELEAALALLSERVVEPPGDDRGRKRALGILLRRGYPSEVAYAAVRRRERESGDSPA